MEFHPLLKQGYTFTAIAGDRRIHVHDQSGEWIGWLIKGELVRPLSEEQTSAMLSTSLRKPKST